MFQTIGIVGISIPDLKEFTVLLTPMNLLLTALLMIWGSPINSSYVIAAIIAFSIGYIVEVFGVNTGVLFGEYSYGPPLGIKLFDTPLMIGVNWFILSFSSLGIASIFSNSFVLRAVISAGLMVLLDVIIEPIAIKLDFWTWAQGDIPLQNYIMWFITALVINLIVSFIIKRYPKNVSLYVFGIQVYFFAILNLIL